MNSIPTVDNGWQLTALILVLFFQSVNIGLNVALAYISTSKQNKLKSAQSDLHTIVNSRLSQLLELTKSSANAEGRLEGASQERKLAKEPEK
jgi:hypothetical protein